MKLFMLLLFTAPLAFGAGPGNTSDEASTKAVKPLQVTYYYLPG